MTIRGLFLILTIAAASLLSMVVKAQNTISGIWGSEANIQITLWMLRGDLRLPVDSTRTNEGGRFVMPLKWKVPAGMYLLDDESTEPIHLLLGADNVKLVRTDTVRFEASPDNLVWQKWMQIKSSFIKKQDALEALIEAYPKGDRFRKIALRELKKQRLNLQKEVAQLLKRNNAPIAARFMAADMPPMLKPGLTPDKKLEALRDYRLSMLSINDTLLIQSDLLPERVLDYLTLYQQKGMSREVNEQSFISAIDLLMQKASAQNKLYLFYLEYLFEGFNRMGFNLITDYLSTLPHFELSKASLNDLFEIERIIGPYSNILSGSVAPPVIGTDINGQAFDLYAVSHPKTLLLFWTETCPHCLQLLPEIKKIKDENTDLHIVSIILSPNQTSLRELLTRVGITEWTHLCQPEGWQSSLVTNYGIYGTPTMYLLDHEKRIIARPDTAEDLRKSLHKP